MLQGRSTAQMGFTQARKGYHMAGAEAPQTRGATLGRTRMRVRMHLWAHTLPFEIPLCTKGRALPLVWGCG